MAKRQPKTSTVEQAVLDTLGDQPRAVKRQLTRFSCNHVGAEIGVKAKAFVRWSQAKDFTIEDEPKKKCPECK